MHSEGYLISNSSCFARGKYPYIFSVTVCHKHLPIGLETGGIHRDRRTFINTPHSPDWGHSHRLGGVCEHPPLSHFATCHFLQSPLSKWMTLGSSRRVRDIYKDCGVFMRTPSMRLGTFAKANNPSLKSAPPGLWICSSRVWLEDVRKYPQYM